MILQIIKNKLGFIRQENSKKDLMAWVLGALVILAPIICIPAVGLSSLVTKTFVIELAIMGMIVWFALRTLKEGKITLPKTIFFTVSCILVVTSLIGALWAPSAAVALWGYGFETTTWFFGFLFFSIIFFSFRILRTEERVFNVLFGLFISSTVVVVIQMLRFFLGTDFLNLWILKGVTDTLVGTWGDFQILLSLMVLFAVITIEMGPVSKKIKWFLGITSIVNIVLLFSMNARGVFLILGFVSLILGFYLFSFAYWDNQQKHFIKNKRVPWGVLILLGVSLLGSVFAPVVASSVARHQSLIVSDVRPSLVSTAKASFVAITRNPAFGYGANTFDALWNKVKPITLSGTPINNQSVDFGFSYLATRIASEGVVTGFLWLIVFVLVIIFVLKQLFVPTEDIFKKYRTVLLGSLVVMGVIFITVMIPSSFVLFIVAIFIGSFGGIAASEQNIQEKTYSFLKDPRTSFFGILMVVTVIIVSLVGIYGIGKKYLSLVRYSQALTEKSSLEQAILYLDQALRLTPHDMYHRKAAEVLVAQALGMAGQLNDSNKQAGTKTIESLLGQSLGHAQQSIKLNSLDYRNYIILAKVYQGMAMLGVNDAVLKAENAFALAQERNPHDTGLDITRAQLYLSLQKTDKALDIINQALNKYPTADAYLLRAKIAIHQKKWTSAISSLTEVLRLNPTDIISLITLGVVYERNGEMQQAERIYTLIKNRFDDGGMVIEKIKASLGANDNQVVDITPKDIVAPIQKKK